MNFPNFYIYRISPCHLGIGKEVICRISIEMNTRAIFNFKLLDI